MLIIVLIIVCLTLYLVHRKEKERKERKRLINRDRATCIAKNRLNNIGGTYESK